LIKMSNGFEIKNAIPGVGKSARIKGKNAVVLWGIAGVAGMITLFAANDNFGGPPEDPDDEELFMKIMKLFKRDQ